VQPPEIMTTAEKFAQ